MYWVLLLLWCVGGTAVFWAILSKRWKGFGAIEENFISTSRVLYPFLPGSPGYMDIKYTLLRHSAATFISAVILYFVNNRFIIYLILFLNVFYTIEVIKRYSYRKKQIKEIFMQSGPVISISMLSALVKDSSCGVTYSVISVVVLYILYGLAYSLR